MQSVFAPYTETHFMRKFSSMFYDHGRTMTGDSYDSPASIHPWSQNNRRNVFTEETLTLRNVNTFKGTDNLPNPPISLNYGRVMAGESHREKIQIPHPHATVKSALRFSYQWSYPSRTATFTKSCELVHGGVNFICKLSITGQKNSKQQTKILQKSNYNCIQIISTLRTFCVQICILYTASPSTHNNTVTICLHNWTSTLQPRSD